MTRKLTTKQQLFIENYIANGFNSYKAARDAGYKQPQSGQENLRNPLIQQAITQHLDKLKSEGILVKEQRVAELARLDQDLAAIQFERAQAAKAAKERGEDVPPGAETGLLTITRKVGPKGVVEEWVVDKALIQERRALMEQAAKELGEHNERIQLMGRLDLKTIDEAHTKLLERVDAVATRQAGNPDA